MCTVRGLNYQWKPFEQDKIIRCIRDNLYSVAAYITPSLKSFGKWCGFEINDEDGYLMYISWDFAHGFITKEKNTELEYYADNVYSYEHAKSIRYDDPDIMIDWSCNDKRQLQDDVLWVKMKMPFLKEM